MNSKIKNIIIAVVVLWAVAGVVVIAIKASNKKSVENNATSSESVYDSYGSWVDYSPTPARFSAMFPVYPTEEKQKLDSSNTEFESDYYSYIAKDAGGSVFILNESVYSKNVNMSAPEKNLKSALNTMVDSDENNELVTSEDLTLGNNKALDFFINNSSLGLSMRGRFILVKEKRTMYQLLYVSKESGSETDFKKFSGSFVAK